MFSLAEYIGDIDVIFSTTLDTWNMYSSIFLRKMQDKIKYYLQ